MVVIETVTSQSTHARLLGSPCRFEKTELQAVATRISVFKEPGSVSYAAHTHCGTLTA
jgi:hypothetical protein